MGKEIEMSNIKGSTPNPNPEPEPTKFSDLRRGLKMQIVITPLASIIFATFMAVVISVFYFTPMWDPVERMDRLKYVVVMADKGYQAGSMNVNVAESVKAAILSSDSSKDLFDWEFVNSTTVEAYPDEYSLEAIKDKVADRKIFAALVFPKYYTQTLLGVYTGLIQTKHYNNPLTYVYDEAKQFTAALVADRAMSVLFSSIDYSLRVQLDKLAVASPTAPDDVIYRPVYRESVNLHPIETMGEYFSQYIGFVIMWIGMLFTISLSHVTFREFMTDTFRLKLTTVFAIRVSIVILTAIISTLFLCIFLDGLGLHMYHGFGAVYGVTLFLSLTFAGMIDLIYNLFSVIGIPVIVFALILQVVTSDGVYAAKIMTKAYIWWNSVTPFAHGVQLFRNAAFDASKDDTGLHIGVIFIWLIAMWVLSYLALIFKLGKRLAHKILPTGLKGFNHFVEFVN